MPRLCGTPGQPDDVALAITAPHLQGARRMGTHLINQNCARAVSPPTHRNIRPALPLPRETCTTCNFHASLMQLLFPHLLFLLFGCNCNRKWDPSVGNAARRCKEGERKCSDVHSGRHGTAVIPCACALVRAQTEREEGEVQNKQKKEILITDLEAGVIIQLGRFHRIPLEPLISIAVS